MAKRIGKYKVGKKENTLSAFGDEGGTISGPITLSGNVTFSDKDILLSALDNGSGSANSTAQYQLFYSSSGYLTASKGHGPGIGGQFNVVCISE